MGDKFTLYDLVKKLIGPVEAVGETRADEKRLENLKSMTILVYLLLSDIQAAAWDADRTEHSMRVIGRHAASFLQDIKDA